MVKIFLILGFSVLFLQSCSYSYLEYDPDAHLSRRDYKKIMFGKEAEEDNDNDSLIAEIPKPKTLLLEPNLPAIAPQKLISLSVTEDIPLKTVLIELSRLSEVEMEIDPNIQGGIILLVKNRPFDEVIDKISQMANLRYEVSNGLLKIEMDTPYLKTYDLKFLDMSRKNVTSLEITTATGNEGLASGGRTTITSESVSNIWEKVKEDLQAMIDANDNNYSNLVTEESGAKTVMLGQQFVRINKQAGIVTVKTSQKLHKEIDDYLSKVKKSISSQVLIEAKIVEVKLNDEFKTGIEWNDIPEVSNGQFNKITSDEIFLGLNITNSALGFTSAVSLLDKFGTTRTLASPRITAINNQQAILSFTENRIYFEVDYDQSTTTNDTTTISTGVDSQMHTLPVGIIVTMLPSIDHNNRSVTLNIKPTISVSTSSVTDPAVELISLDLSDDDQLVTSEIPEVSVKEIDTVLNIKDQQIVVMGGLIDQQSEISESGVPFFKNIPILGALFKTYSKKLTTTETVLFIKATIIDDNSKIDSYDKRFYKSFATDPRPFLY